ncbi:dienelactone hydrolase [Brucella sp. HL-2]|nr:dienelactone hydrolase [Brucella sp. HL-2]MCV9907011.1 dienelactone hydrolase [Brucella sp. HL-2]
MSRFNLLFSAIAMGTTLTTFNAFAADVGVRTFEVPSQARGKNLAVTLWYPAAGSGESVLFGDNRIFQGSAALKDAPFDSGQLPLVILSHGSGGRTEAMGWLAVELAKAGFIVAGPNHPGTTSGDSLPAETPKLWERAQDLSTVINYLTSNPDWSALIDADRIGVVGFSLGGSTALEIVGARASLESYARYCDTYTKWDCAWYAGGRGYADGEAVDVEKLDLRSIDKARFEQSNLDQRIKTAVMIDPGLAQAYVEQSLKEIKIPMSFINLGNAGDVPTAVLADHLAALIPNSTYVTVKDSDHFSFLPECKEGASAFLKSVGEVDPICEETSRERKDIHAEVSNLVLMSLQMTLKR